MKNKFWLIQRGKFNNNIDTATSFLGGRSECLIDPDYMGAAEFEWGAIPKAYRRILGQYDQYSLHVTDLVTTGGVPFCLILKPVSSAHIFKRCLESSFLSITRIYFAFEFALVK